MIFESAFMMVLAFIAKRSCGESVSQPERLVTVQEGQAVSLTCAYESIYSPTLFWYEQRLSGPPQLLLSEYAPRDEEERKHRRGFSAQNDKKKSFPLTKESSELRDSAVYFCAMSDTRCRLQSDIWNREQDLLVLPNLQKSEPSVYELESTNKSHPLSACLFTDYFPGNINVSATGSNLVGIESSVVVVEDQASYGAVLWQNANENLQCVANYDGGDIQAKKDIADSCSGTQMSFQTDERLNLLSLTVLGLRVIFFKSVAVNLLLTFRLWSR
nr:TRAV18 [Tiliqua rugosa]